MEFVNVKKDIYLSAQQSKDIYNNFLYLKEKLENSGFSVGEILDSSFDETISIENGLRKFNNVEDNIMAIHSVLFDIFKTNEKYYKTKVWKPTTPNREAEVWRWIDWLYEAKRLVAKYEVLTDVNGEQVFDVNGERILVLQESE